MKPYVPDALPIEGLDTVRLIRLVGPATAAIARYDGLLQGVVNPAVMLSPLANREAVLSSKIEGTQATVDEVLEYEAGIEFEENKVHDIQEVVRRAADENIPNRHVCEDRGARIEGEPPV